MRRKPVVVSLDGVLLSGNGLLRSTYREMIDQEWIGPEANPWKRDVKGILRHIGQAVTGKSLEQVSSVSKQASKTAIKRVDPNTLDRLRSLSPKNHQLIALSSSPDFAVKPALNWLRQNTGLSFNTATVLSSTFETEHGVYTGEYQQLDKEEAVDQLVQELGGVNLKLGLINGITDAKWSEEHCDEVWPINAGPALVRHLGSAANQLETTS